MSINPFSYGRPIENPDRFIGRRREIEQVYSRLLAANESTSIVGESRTGKTSLLKMISHPDTPASFGIEPDKFTFIYQDFQFIDANTTPTRFWKRVLRSIKRVMKDYEEVVFEINEASKDETIDNYTLDDIFTLIDEEDVYIVLMLDEFENVTRNSQFDNDFFGGLRALAIHHNLALITSSRQDLVELTHSEELRSSPFFNIFATINLKAFTEMETTRLIDSYLEGTDVHFLLSELNMIFALAGYHPYFLQMVCSHLFSAHTRGLADSERHQVLMTAVRSESAPIFQDFWHHSSPSQQILLMVLTMRELEKGTPTMVEDMEKLYGRASQIITELERRTLVIKNTDSGGYHIFSTELREWIADEIVGSTDNLRAWRDWQKKETLIGMLSTDLQSTLADVVRGLNPTYQDLMSNFLLDPATAVPAMALVENFVSRYEQYRETRQQREPSQTMAKTNKPVGNTPKGVLGLVSQKLAQRANQDEDDGATIAQPVKRLSSKPAPPPPPSPSTGSRLKRKAAISPVALGSLVISSVVTDLALDEEGEMFVKGELNWLFNATDHFLRIARDDLKRNSPITTEIPPEAQRHQDADNHLLDHHDDAFLQSLKGPVESLVERLNDELKLLSTLLAAEAEQGTAAKIDLKLQNQKKTKRLEIVRVIEDLVDPMQKAYGVYVSAPRELVEYVADQ